MPSISKVLLNVTDEIGIETFDIDEESFKTIIENSHRCNVLRIVGCTVEVTRKFMIDDKLDFKIKQIDLTDTAKYNDIRK